MLTAVITTGGLGTRLLTSTKGNPKTMLPIYDKSRDNYEEPLLKPLLEYIFENLYDNGFRRFCFIIGKKTKSSILNHMRPDKEYLELLKKRNGPADKRFIKHLKRLYNKILDSEIKWIYQRSPLGFGDALLNAQQFVGKETFLLHAGDSYFPDYDFLKRFIKNHEKSTDVSGSLVVKYLKHVKGFGIATIKKNKQEIFVVHVEEKPRSPKTNYAILPLYIFQPNIFEALKRTKNSRNNELEVTDAIMTLINSNKKLIAFNYGNKSWFDIGTSVNYYKAITFSFKKSITK